MSRFGDVFRARTNELVGVLSAPAPLLLAQLLHDARNDILFTVDNVIDQAVKLRVVKPQTRVGGWYNTFVLAAIAGAPRPPLATARIAVTDSTVASNGLDGRALLALNGMLPGSGARLIGVATTADVAFLLRSGGADVGLLYLTDVKADPRLEVVAALDVDPSMRTTYACAINARSNGPVAQMFINLLMSGEIRPRLLQDGLGVSA